MPVINMKMVNRKAIIDPINIIMGIVAIVGAVFIILNKVDYGLIMLIIATLIEALTRIIK